MSKVRRLVGTKPTDRLNAETQSSTLAGLAVAFVDGLGRLVDLSPTEFLTFSDESDWTFMARDFRAAMGTIIANDERLQPLLPFDNDERVEAE